MAIAEAWSREDKLVFQTWLDPDACGTATVRRGRVVPARSRYKCHPRPCRPRCSKTKAWSPLRSNTSLPRTHETSKSQIGMRRRRKRRARDAK